MTIEEQLRQRGIEQGIQKGHLAALCRILTLRFGALDPELAARLEAARGEDLERLLDRAVTAATIEEFLEHE